MNLLTKKIVDNRIYKLLTNVINEIGCQTTY